jgi:hypothetical protein
MQKGPVGMEGTSTPACVHGRLSGVRRENRPAVAGPVTWVRSQASELLFASLSNGAGEGSRPATGGEIFSKTFPACTLDSLAMGTIPKAL